MRLGRRGSASSCRRHQNSRVSNGPGPKKVRYPDRPEFRAKERVVGKFYGFLDRIVPFRCLYFYLFFLLKTYEVAASVTLSIRGRVAGLSCPEERYQSDAIEPNGARRLEPQRRNDGAIATRFPPALRAGTLRLDQSR